MCDNPGMCDPNRITAGICSSSAWLNSIATTQAHTTKRTWTHTLARHVCYVVYMANVGLTYVRGVGCLGSKRLSFLMTIMTKINQLHDSVENNAWNVGHCVWVLSGPRYSSSSSGVHDASSLYYRMFHRANDGRPSWYLAQPHRTCRGHRTVTDTRAKFELNHLKPGFFIAQGAIAPICAI